MEEARTDYRAALSWLRATSVDPDKLGQIEKFRRVQAEVKSSKERFDHMKSAIQDCFFKSMLMSFDTYLQTFKSIFTHARNPIIAKVHSGVLSREGD